MANLFPDIVPGTTSGSVSASALNNLGRSDEGAIKVVSGSNVLNTESGYFKEGSLVLTKNTGKFWLYSSGSWVDSGSVISTISGIAGSAVMSTTGGSVVKHNVSGIVSGSYNQIQFDDFGHGISGSVIDYSTGWYPAGETWTYDSADDPSFVFTTGVDVSGKYSAGMKIKCTQSGSIVYGIITQVSGSVVTMYGGTDYNLTDAAITLPYYSLYKSPLGFPLNPVSWTVEVTDNQSRNQVSAANGTYYNLGSISISVPIGCWNLEYAASAANDNATNTTTCVTALSTGSATVSDVDLSFYTQDNSRQMSETLHRRNKYITLASKTTYYMIIATLSNASTWLGYQSDLGKLIIRATCAYL